MQPTFDPNPFPHLASIRRGRRGHLAPIAPATPKSGDLRRHRPIPDLSVGSPESASPNERHSQRLWRDRHPEEHQWSQLGPRCQDATLRFSYIKQNGSDAGLNTKSEIPGPHRIFSGDRRAALDGDKGTAFHRHQINIPCHGEPRPRARGKSRSPRSRRRFNATSALVLNGTFFPATAVLGVFARPSECTGPNAFPVARPTRSV